VECSVHIIFLRPIIINQFIIFTELAWLDCLVHIGKYWYHHLFASHANISCEISSWHLFGNSHDRLVREVDQKKERLGREHACNRKLSNANTMGTPRKNVCEKRPRKFDLLLSFTANRVICLMQSELFSRRWIWRDGLGSSWDRERKFFSLWSRSPLFL